MLHGDGTSRCDGMSHCSCLQVALGALLRLWMDIMVYISPLTKQGAHCWMTVDFRIFSNNLSHHDIQNQVSGLNILLVP